MESAGQPTGPPENSLTVLGVRQIRAYQPVTEGSRARERFTALEVPFWSVLGGVRYRSVSAGRTFGLADQPRTEDGDVLLSYFPR